MNSYIPIPLILISLMSVRRAIAVGSVREAGLWPKGDRRAPPIVVTTPRVAARAVKCSQLKHQLARALKPARAAAYLS